MRILCNILAVLFVTATAVGQQINPVPDYIFRNSMSVGRNAPTDTSAYFSIGPRFGATRGFMPPMVTDTASVTGTKRNGLLIYSIQRNSFLYWDSTGSRWSRIAANLDTLLLSTRAWRQKGDDSLAALIGARIGGSGTTNRVPKFTASTTLGNSQIFDNGTDIGIGTITPQSYSGYKGVTIDSSSGSFIQFRRGGINRLLIASTPNESYFFETANLPIYFATNNLERFRVAANGNFLVGTSTDNGEKFQANGTGRITLSTYLATVPGSNVGIGTTSPRTVTNQTGLTIDGTASFVQLRQSGNEAFQFGSGASETFFYEFRNVPLVFSTNQTEAFRVFANQRVGINTGSTDIGDYRLQVVGNSYFSGNLYVRDTLVAATTNPSARFGIGIGAPNLTMGWGDNTQNHRIRSSQSGNDALMIQLKDSKANLEILPTPRFRFVYGNDTLVFSVDTVETKIAKGKLEITSGSITTGNPSGGTRKPWKIGEAATVSPTSPNRTIRVEIDGVVYYLHAKTTND